MDGVRGNLATKDQATQYNYSSDTDVEEPFVFLPDTPHNPFMRVNVNWYGEVYAFRIRRFTPLAKITKIIASKEDVTKHAVKYFYNGHPVEFSVNSLVTLNHVRPESTITFDGRLVNMRGMRHVSQGSDPDHVAIELRYGNIKLFVRIRPDERCERLYALAVIKFKIRINQFVLKYGSLKLSCETTINDIKRRNPFFRHRFRVALRYRRVNARRPAAVVEAAAAPPPAESEIAPDNAVEDMDVADVSGE